MEGKNGIKITNFWSCVNGRNVEVDPASASSSSSLEDQREMPSSSSSSDASTSPEVSPKRSDDVNGNAAQSTPPPDSTSSGSDPAPGHSSDTTAISTTNTNAGEQQPSTSQGIVRGVSTTAAWNENDGPADSTVMFAETGLNEFGCVFKDDDDDTQAFLFDFEIAQDIDQSDKAFQHGNSYCFDVSDFGVDISFEFSRYDQDFQLAYEILQLHTGTSQSAEN